MRRFVSFLGLLALILILLDIALIASKRSLLVHVREYGAGEIIKTKKFGDVGGRDPAVYAPIGRDELFGGSSTRHIVVCF